MLCAFVGPRPEKAEIRHLDGNPSNNTLENLAYGTARENKNDMIRHGRMVRGSRLKGSVLTEEKVETLRSLSEQGMSIAAAAREVGCKYDTAYRAVRRLNWRHI